MRVKYRPDIDGLRAIAVLAVVFNHAGINLFSGGYIGVDVFFVISGYLITTILFREIQENEFSIIKFYERRIRRIFPALFATLSVVLIVSSILYDADSFGKIGKSVTATTLFYSNFLFWSQAGYFEGPSQLKPLLHTWSLAVEEQFYIFFPIFLWFLNQKFKNKIPLALFLVTIISFSFSIYGISRDPSEAFYLPHMRIWELLIGSILSLNLFPSTQNSVIRNALSSIGFLLIITPVFVYTKETVFPGWTALAPTLGTGLIIYSGYDQKNYINKLLGTRPFVFVGLISYSLYLWHWPILVFTRYYAIKDLTFSTTLFLLAIIAMVSILSWHFIEKPFRAKSFAEGKKIFLYAGMVICLSSAVGTVINLNNGFPNKPATKNSGKETNKNRWTGLSKNCKENEYDIMICNLGAKKESPQFMLWGDSFATAQVYGIHLSALQHGIAGQMSFDFGCPPLLGIIRSDQPNCFKNNTQVINYLENHPELKTVILVGRWTLSAEGHGYLDKQSEKEVALSDGWKEAPQESNNLDLFTLGLTRTVKKLKEMNRNVVIIAQIPEIGYDVPSAYSIAQRTGRDIEKIIAPTIDQYNQRNLNVSNTINLISEYYSVMILDPSKVLCDEKICHVILDGKPAYKDLSHLSVYGSEYLSFLFDPIFELLSAPALNN